MYFSYCPENGFRFHETEQEAREMGVKNFAAFEGYAATDGWGENVDDVCWGVVRQRVTEVACRDPDPEQGDNTDFGEIIDYKLIDIEPSESPGQIAEKQVLALRENARLLGEDGKYWIEDFNDNYKELSDKHDVPGDAWIDAASRLPSAG